MKDTTKCLSPRQVAELLGICLGLCYQKIREGSIPAVRLGRRYIIPVVALNALLDGCRGEVRLCPDASEKPQTVTGAFTDAKTVDGLDPSG